jgi:hypothetical protein
MAKKRKKIEYKKERVVMADILPYEVPVTFSNRHFYNFLVDNEIEFSKNCISWKKDDEAFDKIVKFIFNIKGGNVVEEEGKKIFKINEEKPYKKGVDTIPFSYKISHKQKEFRQLTVIHPLNQLTIIDFYNKYKELILFYTNRSEYSIRRPVSIAKFTFFNDKKHQENKVEEPERDTIELFGKEYENLKTFFSYKEYSNVHKFYESYIYQRNEKKFNTLFKFDISKCFDSIYTHTLSWALLNKEIVKENVQLNDFTFGGAFDILMQKLNYNETNGIIIGPEFSRIFAEIILQQIDFSVNKVLENSNNKLKHKTDYAIFRYVDDYFLFFNEQTVKDKIIETFNAELLKFNLHISEPKSFTYEKPIITELTIAKERISDLLNKLIELKSESISDDNQIADEDNSKKIPRKYSLYFNSKKAIIDFKTIIKETEVSYKDILNFVLAVVDRKYYSLIKKLDKAEFENEEIENRFKDTFVKFNLELIDFIMFLYSVSPRVNTTIKLCNILSKTTKFINQKAKNRIKYFTLDQKNIIFKKIFDDISLVLNKNRNSEYTQVETLYLLIALRDLGNSYRLDNKTLLKYLNIKEIDGKYNFPYEFNYWSITVLLFYIKDIKRYDKLKSELKQHIKEKYITSDTKNVSKNAELVILTMDLLSCPYLENQFKSEILILCGISCHQRLIVDKFIKQENIFTKWKNFDFEKELNTKRGQEVY